MKNTDLKKIITYGVAFEVLMVLLSYLILNIGSVTDLPSLAVMNQTLLAAGTLFGLLSLLYVYVFKIVDIARIPIKAIILFSILFNLTVIFTKPFLSNDANSYIYRSRIITKYGENPYLRPYSDFQDDRYFSDLNNIWSKNTTAYGPLFVSFSAVLGYLSQDNIGLNLYLYKIIFVLMFLASATFVYLITNNRKSLYLLTWNPFLIYNFSVDAHNDAMVILLLSLSFYFLFQKRSNMKHHLVSWALLFLSVLVKFYTVVLLPFYVLGLLRKYSSVQKKTKLLVWFFLVSVLTSAFLYFPYWEGTIIFKRLAEIKQLVNVPTALNVLILKAIIGSVISGLPWIVYVNLSRFIFLLISAYLLFSFMLTRKISQESILEYSSKVLGAFFLVGVVWLLPWYFTTLIFILCVWYALSKSSRGIELYIFLITFYGFFQLLLVIYG